MNLIERVVAAKAAAESKYAAQAANGVAMDPNQQAEILIAQVQAILAGEHLEPEPEKTDGAA